MRTTLLNPTVWLLMATLGSALYGAFRGTTAQSALDRVLHGATRWPALLLLGALAVAGLGSRAVLGYFSPGAYAQEVVAARSFLAERQLYGGAGAGRAEVAEALGNTALPPALTDLAVLSPCEATAMAERAQFYTEHAHTPMLLLAGVPIVAAGGGKALYVSLVLLSLAAVAAMAAALMARTGVPWRSRAGLLALIGIAGWQPVLAGVKQGDAVLPAAGLVALAWYMLRRDGRPGAGIAASLAACIALPATGALAAAVRAGPRAAIAGLVVFAAAIAGAAAMSGWDVIPRFIETASLTATTYAAAPSNYGVAGRLAATGAPAGLLAVALAGGIVLTAWLARAPEAALAAFSVLGLLIAPVVWSQHLALLFVPAAVLLIGVRHRGSAWALAGWSALILICSLPDAGAFSLSAMMAGPFGIPAFPVVPLALAILWTWVISEARRTRA